ncbi:hypothetical protein Q8W71_07840 [Methylobacterium sp. NEAU 140]|uniref:hypothetical protein n=1 Tax=Methylobacterium sp. NEAU 140 TaxID=3064945 RepID=UPI0027358C36|nr:hypothetical protein [Methylobacterium sp. NEAU 140]MDP4022530.1 hypothetical protein [Methylobacterium sp. NEAU 140]
MPNDRDSGPTGRPHATLGRIADALGQPRSLFYDDGAATADLASLIELVRLWDGLRRDTDREEVLALARTLAAAQDARDDAAE